MSEWFAASARSVAVATSNPLATFTAALLVVAWGVAGPLFHFSDTWQLVMNTATSVVTFLMVFILNNAQTRDTTAINIKLDSIIVAIDAADNRVIGLERDTVKQTDEVAAGVRATAAASKGEQT